MITAKQSKAARALLGWTLEDLAQHSGVARNALAKFENNVTTTRQSSLEAIYKAFSIANIEFTGTSGVREKEDGVELFTGRDCLQKLWQNILFTFGDNGGEVLITNVDERRTIEKAEGDVYQHLMNLKEKNITERLLSCEGDTFFIAPKEYYRWIPKEVFSMSTATFIYADKVAYFLWSKNVIVLVHCKKASEAEKERFEYMWKKAKIPPINDTDSSKSA